MIFDSTATCACGEIANGKKLAFASSPQSLGWRLSRAPKAIAMFFSFSRECGATLFEAASWALLGTFVSVTGARFRIGGKRG